MAWVPTDLALRVNATLPSSLLCSTTMEYLIRSIHIHIFDHVHCRYMSCLLLRISNG